MADEHMLGDDDQPRGLIDQLRELMDEKLENFKKDIVAEQSELSGQLEVRLRSSTYEFRSKGNKVQHEFNNNVSGFVSNAVDMLSKVPPNVERATALLQEGMNLLRQRNKLIMIADSSDGGWTTVAEYEHKPVASDSEDDRRIRKADNSAVRKLQKRRSDRGRRRSQPYTPATVTSGDVADNSGARGFFRPRRTVQSSDLCFLCGERGHWRRSCPKSAGASTSAVSGNIA